MGSVCCNPDTTTSSQAVRGANLGEGGAATLNTVCVWDAGECVGRRSLLQLCSVVKRAPPPCCLNYAGVFSAVFNYIFVSLTLVFFLQSTIYFVIFPDGTIPDDREQAEVSRLDRRVKMNIWPNNGSSNKRPLWETNINKASPELDSS